MRNPSIQCPAAQERHPVLSPNKLDIECRVAGFMQPARRRDQNAPGGGDPVVCCVDYARCNVWKTHVEVIRFGSSTKAQRDQASTARRVSDTLAD